MAAFVSIVLSGTKSEIVDWLAARWVDRAPVGLHVPFAIRDSMTPEEWVDLVGCWPTFSVVGDGWAERNGELIERYAFRITS